MTSRALTDEEKEKYENELSEFITNRIKNVGGSLQFQHLTSFLTQLSPATRNAIASNKVQLMKFLKSHTKLFSIDSKGVVTIKEPGFANDQENFRERNEETVTKVTLPLNIDAGEGYVSKLYAEFGYINAIKPIQTKIYFRASEYKYGNKDALLTDYDIEIGSEVLFNAVKGHSDSEAQYRAIKVWPRPSDTEHSTQQNNVKHINGEGIVQKLFPNHGFISTNDCNKDIFFHKSILDIDDSNNNLSDYLKVGDSVEFTAVHSTQKDSKSQFQAIVVRKKKNQKLKIQPATSRLENTNELEEDPTGSERPIKNIPLSTTAKNKDKAMLRNAIGRISPHESGINILYKDEEIINGDTSIYYLYGTQVSDISWEFSDGDEVHFDAVKIDTEHGWRAVLVWVGEKPNNVKPSFGSKLKEFDDYDDETHEESRSSMKLSSYVLQSKGFLNKIPMDGNQSQNRRMSRNQHAPSRKKDDYSANQYEDHKVNSKNQNYFPNISQHSRKQSHKEDRENVSKQGHLKKGHKSIFNKNKQNITKKQSSMYYDKECSSSESESSISKQSPHSKETHKQESNKFNRKFLVEESRQDDSSEEDDFRNSSKFIEDNQKSNKFQGNDEFCEEDTLERKEEFIKPSIKVFKDLDCKITIVHCKCAFAEHPDLKKPAYFFANEFFYKGLSAEDLQLEDLKEKLSPGKRIKINCFEIVDDYGKFHNLVTLACIGPDPNILEKTPQDFIEENGLKVTINEENYEIANQNHLPSSSTKYLNSIASSSDSEDSTPSPKNFSSEDMSDDDSKSLMVSHTVTPNVLDSEMLNVSQSNVSNVFKEKVLDVKEVAATTSLQNNVNSLSNCKLLMELVSQKLERKGLFYEPEVDLNTLSDEIVDLVISQKMKKNGNCVKCDATSSAIHWKQRKHKEVQTIVTGEVVAQTYLKKSVKIDDQSKGFCRS